MRPEKDWFGMLEAAQPEYRRLHELTLQSYEWLRLQPPGPDFDTELAHLKRIEEEMREFEDLFGPLILLSHPLREQRARPN